MIIYTAIFDGYDKLVPHIWRGDDNTKFYCISNFIKSKSKMNWDIIDVDMNIDSSRKNRYYKINSHKIFPDEEYTIYIDPTFMITKDFSNKVEQWLGNNDIAVMMHPQRNSVYEESNFLIEEKPHKLDSVDIVKEQMSIFLNEGFPESAGVNQGGFIIRRNTSDVRKFNEYWWDIIKKYSKRDQLSFTYVSWKLGIPYSVLPRNEIESYTQRVAWHV